MASSNLPPGALQVAFEQADTQHLTRQLQALRAAGSDVICNKIPEEDGGGIILLSDNVYGPKLNRVMGLGLTSPVNSAIFDQIDLLASTRNARPCFMIPDFVDPTVNEILARRGYVQDGAVQISFVDLSLPLKIRPTEPGIRMEKITPADAEQFINISLAGFGSNGRPPALLRKLAELALARDDTTLWFVYLNGQLAGSCGLAVLESENGHRIAQLYIDSTLPDFRGRGLHRSMITERLKIAKDEFACDYVILLARGGSGSARNAAAVGFREAYDRPIWVKAS